MNIEVISFYTPGVYAEHVERLLDSLRAHGLSHTVKEFTFPSWSAAVCHKPVFILEQLEALSVLKDGLLWTDADSIVRSVPDWSILERADVAWHTFKRGPHHEEEYLTGTMYFADLVKVKEFLRAWIRRTPQFSHTDTPEQHALKAAWDSHGHGLSRRDLPPSWCMIHDDMRTMYPDVEPIIEHYQASRTQKR